MRPNPVGVDDQRRTVLVRPSLLLLHLTTTTTTMHTQPTAIIRAWHTVRYTRTVAAQSERHIVHKQVAMSTLLLLQTSPQANQIPSMLSEKNMDAKFYRR